MRVGFSRDPDHAVSTSLWRDRNAVLVAHDRVLIIVTAQRGVFSTLPTAAV